MNRSTIYLFLFFVVFNGTMHAAQQDQSDLRKEMLKKHLSERVARTFIPAIEKEDIDQMREAIASFGDAAKTALNIPVVVSIDGEPQCMFLLQYLVRIKARQIVAGNTFVTNAISLLVNSGAELEIIDNRGNCLLHDAVVAGNLDLIKLFLSFNLTVDWRNDRWETPLLLAVKNGRVDVVDFLLQNGATSNFYDCEKRYPLHYACMLDDAFVSRAMVTKLLEQPTCQSVIVVDRSGHTPADYARDRGYTNVVAIFMAYVRSHERAYLFSPFNTARTKPHAPKLPDDYRSVKTIDEKNTAARKNLRQVVNKMRTNSGQKVICLTSY